MDVNHKVRLIGGGIFFIALIFSTHSDAHEPVISLRQECIGQFLLGVPEKVEFAMTQRDGMLDNSGSINIAFADGEIPVGAAYFIEHKIDISKKVTVADFENLKKAVETLEKQRKIAHLQKGERKIAESIRKYEIKEQQSFAWESVAGVEVYLYRGDHIYRYLSSSLHSAKEAANKAVDFLGRIQARATFASPIGKGICFPHTFFSVHANADYQVGVAMRLKDHPEIEILFEDSEALNLDHPRRVADPQANIRLFMETELMDTYSRIEYLWYPETFSMAGTRGVAAFAKVRRGEVQEDFVFIAFASGVSAQVSPARNLKLYIARNAKRAAGTPISEVEFRKLSESIVRSISSLR